MVFLHGFLETHLIWQQFSSNLSKQFSVIAFDLPGFGQSSLPEQIPFALSDVASVIIACLKKITSEKISLIGHSLGGYVALAMVEQAPELFSSLTLFHSTAFADSLEKKESRTKTIEFVKRHGALAFTANFVPPLFANPKHEAIPFVTAIATQTPQETVVQYLMAMRDRPERLKVLENFQGSVLFLAGSKDSVISVESLKTQAKIPKYAFLEVFEGVGHMVMFEMPDHSRKVLSEFLNKIF